MKDKLITFVNKHKCSKIFAAFGIVAVLLSCMIIPSAAAEDTTFQTIAPITFNDFSGNVSAVAFPGAHSLPLYFVSNNEVTAERTYLNYGDYSTNTSTRIKTMTYNGVTVSYFELYVYCNYQNINVNGTVYDPSISGAANTILTDVYQFEVYPVSGSYDSTTQYSYRFSVLLYSRDLYELGYEEGFTAGRADGYSAGYESGSSSTVVESARTEGYNAGYAAGRVSSDSANLGHNLIGDTLSAPMDGLNDFVLYDSDGPDGEAKPITLGLVVGGAIALTLFMAFLKLFAGG